MRRLIIIFTLAFAILTACQPEVYTGPLDSPIGSWEGIRSEYFFNGEKVADLDSCETTAISFYRQGLCCIENVKGAFPFTYDEATGYLQIDMSLWEVSLLTGAEMVMTYLYTAYPAAEEPAEPQEDKNGVTLPAEFKGFEINADTNGYYYINDAGETVYCNFKGWTDQDSQLIIDFWFDSHTDYFIPLVVETKK